MYQTARTIINPFQPQDFVALHQLFCEQEEAMRLTLKGGCLTLKEFLNLLEQQFILTTDAQLGFWVVRNAIDHAVMGITGYLPCNYLGAEDVEFGFILGEQYWGQGFATELGDFLINHYAPNILKAKRVLATVSPLNKGSNKVMKKLGLSPIKEITIASRGARIVYSKDL